jgi:NADH:ubiquinone oxidoreductase subunit K
MASLNIFFLLFFSFVIFFLGILGIFITRKNIIIILISIELMLLAVNFNFAIFSVLLEDVFGQIFVLYVLTLAGAEAAIGLAILIIFYRIRGIITVNFVTSLKG